MSRSYLEVRGINFAVEHIEGGLLGHSYVHDGASSLRFVVIEEEPDLQRLTQSLSDTLDTLVEHARNEGVQEPMLYGAGHL